MFQFAIINCLMFGYLLIIAVCTFKTTIALWGCMFICCILNVSYTNDSLFPWKWCTLSISWFLKITSQSTPMGPYSDPTVKRNCSWKAILSPSVSRSWPVRLSCNDDLFLLQKRVEKFWEGHDWFLPTSSSFSRLHLQSQSPAGSDLLALLAFP